MPELRSCYFCGTVDGSLQKHPLIAPDLDPPDDLQRTVVLCPTCRQKFSNALEPVVTYFRDAHTDAGTADVPGSASQDERGPAPLSPGVDEPDPGTAAGSDEAPADGTPAVPADDEPAADEPTATTAADEPTARGTPDDATATDRQPAGEDAGDEPAAGDAGREGRETAAGGVSTGEPTGDDGGDAAGGTADELPDGYGRVLRFLQNREFPVDRGEMEDVVTGVYELSPAEAREIFDTAVDRGVLVEDGDLLRLPSEG